MFTFGITEDFGLQISGKRALRTKWRGDSNVLLHLCQSNQSFCHHINRQMLVLGNFPCCFLMPELHGISTTMKKFWFRTKMKNRELRWQTSHVQDELTMIRGVIPSVVWLLTAAPISRSKLTVVISACNHTEHYIKCHTTKAIKQFTNVDPYKRADAVTWGLVKRDI